MNKHILIKGLLSGLVVSATLAISVALCYTSDNFEGSMVAGYTAMAISLVFVFTGIKKERDLNGGVISFGKAFKTGLIISFIASSMYVATWLVDYYVFIPDFMERYTSYVMKEAAEKGTPAAELAEEAAKMNEYKAMYQNPVWVILLTYMEIFPLGLIITLVAALIFKKKTPAASA